MPTESCAARPDQRRLVHLPVVLLARPTSQTSSLPRDLQRSHVRHCILEYFGSIEDTWCAPAQRRSVPRLPRASSPLVSSSLQSASKTSSLPRDLQRSHIRHCIWSVSAALKIPAQCAVVSTPPSSVEDFQLTSRPSTQSYTALHLGVFRQH